MLSVMFVPGNSQFCENSTIHHHYIGNTMQTHLTLKVLVATIDALGHFETG